MNFAFKDTGSGLDVSIAGRFTFADAAKFKDILGRMPEAAGRRLVFDLSAVEFMDSAAMGMLLLARDTARDVGARLVLRAPSGQARRILDAARFEMLFELVEA